MLNTLKPHFGASVMNELHWSAATVVVTDGNGGNKATQKQQQRGGPLNKKSYFTSWRAWKRKVLHPSLRLAWHELRRCTAPSALVACTHLQHVNSCISKLQKFLCQVLKTSWTTYTFLGSQLSTDDQVLYFSKVRYQSRHAVSNPGNGNVVSGQGFHLKTLNVAMEKVLWLRKFKKNPAVMLSNHTIAI